MAGEFRYDVFINNSREDAVVACEITDRLRRDGLRIWSGEGTADPHRVGEETIERALEESKAQVFLMSRAAFESDWVRLEAKTFRFRDPLNGERRFIPVRLDDSPIPGSLCHLSYVDWRNEDHEDEYARLLMACRASGERKGGATGTTSRAIPGTWVHLDYPNTTAWCYAFSGERPFLLSGSFDKTVRLWNAETGDCVRRLKGECGVRGLAWSKDEKTALAGLDDSTVEVWDIDQGESVWVAPRSGPRHASSRLRLGHTDWVVSVAIDDACEQALSGSYDHTIRHWDLQAQSLIQVIEGHTDRVRSVSFSPDGERAISGSDDKTVRVWDLKTGHCALVLEGHSRPVLGVAWTPDGRHLLSVSEDQTVRVWNIATGDCIRVMEGHTSSVLSVAAHPHSRHCLSGAEDGEVRLWELESGRSIVLSGSPSAAVTVAWSGDGSYALAGARSGAVGRWNLEGLLEKSSVCTTRDSEPIHSGQILYTNAKVLLVGESGVGKTGLARRLVADEWQPSDSTVGAWATQWRLPVSWEGDLEREIWLWDFGGQADQRLIHQLYMDETALAILVFDGQKDDLFDRLSQWDHDLCASSTRPLSKLLVAGRVDAGGMRVSRDEVEAFGAEHGYLSVLETSAKTNVGCEDLKNAVLDAIQWERIPWHSSPLLFKRLKEEIIRLKDEGRVLMRFNELRETLQLRMEPEEAGFSDTELKAVVGLLAGPGVVWELSFGSWVLLQPELINAYGQAVIQTLRSDRHQRGCLPEERVLKGDLVYSSSIPRLERDEEHFVLLAMHQTLIERGLCLREHTDAGELLVFPSFYRRERPDPEAHPPVLVSYRFSGFLDEVYATLVVRLHHSRPFQHDQLWRYAADFKTLTGKLLGLQLMRRPDGSGELAVYFDPSIPLEEKIIFSMYVHEHLLQKATEVLRFRHYVCPYCGTPVGNRDIPMRRLEDGKNDIVCANCEKRFPLWDELEERFSSDETKQRVHDLQRQSQVVLDNESKERVLVGDVISIVSLAGQISREKSVCDHGIDMEIELKDDNGEATGQLLLLQLKSGDSHLRRRKDGKEVFTLRSDSHARYWMRQKFPVFLVVRSSVGVCRWMEVREWLCTATNGGRDPVRQIIFDGERLDADSVRRWRDKMIRA